MKLETKLTLKEQEKEAVLARMAEKEEIIESLTQRIAQLGALLE